MGLLGVREALGHGTRDTPHAASPPEDFWVSANPLLLSSAHAEMTTLPKVDTKCTTPSLIPPVNGNTVRSFSTHGQLSAAKGGSTTAHALISD